ncbi:hypothetical protein, partial [Alistipes putredinis]|uniref:hypothetical protein n=1 Tax=Alistipes putredinis TaxID=28117 RepID=UPI003A9338ED
ASALQAEGRGFESLSSHQVLQTELPGKLKTVYQQDTRFSHFIRAPTAISANSLTVAEILLKEFFLRPPNHPDIPDDRYGDT